MDAEKVTYYVCDQCQAEHRDWDDANECCEPEIYEVELWECTKCHEPYETQTKAESCCEVDE